MIPPISILRTALPALAALLVWSVASSAQAQTGGQTGAQGQTSQRPKASPAFPRVSVSGSYLAARHAGVSRDAAAASIYYRVALRGDPRNPELLARAFMAVLQSGEIDEVGAARGSAAPGRQERPCGPPRAGRSGDQAEAICGGAPATRAVGARPDHRSGGGAAHGLDLCRPDREQGGDRRHRQARRPGVVQSAEGSARRTDPRPVRSAARCAQAAGARLQDRPDRAAGRAGLRQPALARRATATRR